MTFYAATEIKPQRNKLVIPAFSYPQTWTGVSELLYRYPIAQSVPISIKLPITEHDEFVLGASYADPDGHTYRWRFWEGGVLWYPVYNGEKIGSNGYIELWSVYGVDPAVSTEDIELEISLHEEPVTGYCGSCCENSSTSTTLVPELVGETSPPIE